MATAAYDDLGSKRLFNHYLIALIGILFLAAFLRIVPMIARNYVGDADQQTYLEIADEILRGQYPTGDTGPGFGAVIALMRVVGIPAQWSGRAASLLLGLVVVLLAPAVARRLYGAVAGLIMAFIVAIHAGLVDISMSGVAENALLVALLGGMLLLIGSGNKSSGGQSAVAGLVAGFLFGWGYLVRPDGALYGGILCAAWFVLAGQLAQRPTNARVSAAVALAIIVAVLGFNTFAIWRATGEVRPQQRCMALASVHGDEFGEAQEQALFTYSTGSAPAMSATGQSIPARVKCLVHNSHTAYATILPEGLDPLLMSFAGLGFILLLQRKKTRWQTLAIASVWLVFPALSVAYVAHLRHLFPLIVVALLWAAYGIEAASRAIWNEDSKLKSLSTTPISHASVALICGLILIAQAKPNADLTQAAFNGEVPREEKTAGRWLKEHGHEGSIIIERKGMTGWYAGMRSVSPPATKLDDVLTFAAERRARYLIVSERRLPYRPFLKPLLDPNWRGNASLKRIYQTPLTKREPFELVIYEFGEPVAKPSRPVAASPT